MSRRINTRRLSIWKDFAMALPKTDPFSIVPPLSHEQLRAKVTARRVRLLTLGYERSRLSRDARSQQ